MIGVVFAGGHGTRMQEWIRERYGKDIPKLLIPVGKEGEPFLTYNIRNTKPLFDELFVLSHNERIKDFCEDMGVEVILHPDNMGRGGSLRYGVESGKIGEDDIITINGSDIVRPDAIKKMIDHDGDAILLGRIYRGKFPDESKPNVAYFDDVITEMRREDYEPRINRGLHTGVSRISREHYDELGYLPEGKDVEESIFQRIIDEGKMGYELTDTWISLKVPEHGEMYQDFDITEFVSSSRF